MVFIIVQIRSGAKVVKLWFGCVVNDSCTLSDIYNEFSRGDIDGGAPISDEYLEVSACIICG